MYKEIFQIKLKEARKKREFTQDEVAKELGVSRTNITNYETGRTEPDIETLCKLIELYNISADWLLGTGMSR